MIRRALPFVLTAVAASFGVLLLLERHAGSMLREELELLQHERAQLRAIARENAGLASQQPSDAELSRLRADHAAVQRLRKEIEVLRERIAAEERKADVGRAD